MATGAKVQACLLALAVSAALAGLPEAAHASTITSLKPESIISALQNAGYKAKLSNTDDGDPVIDTAADGNAIRIVMTDCKDHKGCSTTEFVGVWDCSDSIAKCKSATSEKNNEESPVHIILSEDGKTAITYSYLLYDENGISENLLVKNLTTFSFYNTQFALAVSKK